ncbi:uncharacterized protein LOC125561742 [Nematostella vectensis]|uniref:uncharacterized protein LOC125561742 n=1 Tax=Nematostella vectensis TaxID=45351 RepID=UPI0020778560|nr:uncharacterized protein LOC125561742 [Nematostella vectensis]
MNDMSNPQNQREVNSTQNNNKARKQRKVAETSTNENSPSGIESIFQLENRNRVTTELQLTSKPHHKNTIPIVCRIDTGAEPNVIAKKDIECLFPKKKGQLEKPGCKIMSYGGHEISNLGQCQLYVHHKGQVKEITFNVTEVSGPAIIGCKTCDDLELVKYNLNLDKAPKAQSHSQHDNMHTPLTKGKLVNSYKDRFEGRGGKEGDHRLYTTTTCG